MGEKLDCIIFGATGFSGKYTVFEAASVLKDLRWGIAGRNKEKLQVVLKDMGAKANKDISSTPIVIADVNDQDSLLEMAKRARVIVNTCGPYRLFGEPVVRACIEAGTHHVDISGESQYMELMQLKYNKQAQERGVYIVSACGFDSIPADMGVVFAEKNFDGVVNSVESIFQPGERGDGGGGAVFNYGTWESAVHFMGQSNELRNIRRQLYPQDLPKFLPVHKNRYIFRSREANSICLPFTDPDRSVVMRTQRFLYETDNKRPVQIHSYIAVGYWFRAIAIIFVAAIFGAFSLCTFGRKLLLQHPKFFSFGFVTREGPTEARMEQIYFNTMIKASGWSESERLPQASDQYLQPPRKTLVVQVSGPNPAYGSTCVAVLCTAITILKDKAKMPGNGGVLPPGAAFSKTSLIDELGKHEHGMKFRILSKN